MLNKLFPKTDYKNIQYDDEGLYSITNYKEADLISIIIKNNYNYSNKLRILDGTGGLGGNTISFSKNFKKVTSIELNNKRYQMLKNNIKLYNFKNVEIINCNSIDYLFKNKNDFDIFFFDPPWGGPNYKKEINLKLKMENYSLSKLAEFIDKNKMLVLKLPFNYDFSEFNNFNYKLYKINKYYILLILL
jgi:16S rRNA G966 N2-methylase RsmD